MPKVCQMLDSGWIVRIYRNDLVSYTAEADHEDDRVLIRLAERLKSSRPADFPEDAWEDAHWNEGSVMTDDFTPEKALTRLAYKVHGEILPP